MKKVLLSLALVVGLNANIEEELINNLNTVKVNLNNITNDNGLDFDYGVLNCSENNCLIKDMKIYLLLKDVFSPLKVEIFSIDNIRISAKTIPDLSDISDFYNKAKEQKTNINIKIKGVKANDFIKGFLQSITFINNDEFSKIADFYKGFLLDNFVSDYEFSLKFVEEKTILKYSTKSAESSADIFVVGNGDDILAAKLHFKINPKYLNNEMIKEEFANIPNFLLSAYNLSDAYINNLNKIIQNFVYSQNGELIIELKEDDELLKAINYKEDNEYKNSDLYEDLNY